MSQIPCGPDKYSTFSKSYGSNTASYFLKIFFLKKKSQLSFWFPSIVFSTTAFNFSCSRDLNQSLKPSVYIQQRKYTSNMWPIVIYLANIVENLNPWVWLVHEKLQQCNFSLPLGKWYYRLKIQIHTTNPIE